MLKPSVVRDGGESWELAIVLMAGSKSTLTRDEFVAFLTLVKESDDASLMKAFDSFEVPSANCVTSALSTRHSNTPGIGEASEIWSLASRYQDSGQIMPPATAKWDKSWYISMIPDFAEDWIDDLQDVYNRMVLATSPEYNVTDPPSLLGGPQSAGYRHTLYDILRSNIQAYTDINMGTSPTGTGGDEPVE